MSSWSVIPGKPWFFVASKAASLARACGRMRPKLRATLERSALIALGSAGLLTVVLVGGVEAEVRQVSPRDQVGMMQSVADTPAHAGLAGSPTAQSPQVADCARSMRMASSGVEETGKSPARPLERATIDLITHNSIEINRPLAVVWPLIVDSNAWTQLGLLHGGGPAGQVGELFCVVDPAMPATIQTFAENVEMTTERRRAFKVYDKHGSLGGYVIWTLTEAGGRTVVEYDLYYESVLSSDATPLAKSSPSLAQQRQTRQDKADRKAESELLTLKKLVESK
jgi:hypothetical protein